MCAGSPPRVRDPRLVRIRRRAKLTDPDHRLLSLWAAACAEHVLHLFEEQVPADLRLAKPSRWLARGQMAD